MGKLSITEQEIAETYCHGLTDKEVANIIGKPVWTIRTHKKHIYNKLGISTTHELVLYMVAKFTNHKWDLKELRLKGLSAILCCIILVDIFNCHTFDNGIRVRTQTSKTIRTRTRNLYE